MKLISSEINRIREKNKIDHIRYNLCNWTLIICIICYFCRYLYL